MDKDKHIHLLQLTYASVLAEAVHQFGQEGILERLTERKRKEQMATGSMKASKFGISSPREVFLKLSSLFRCADWKIDLNEEGFSAETKSCLLCGLSKKMSTHCPCNLYCLDPMEGMVKGLRPEVDFIVMETMWDGEKCRVEVNG